MNIHEAEVVILAVEFPAVRRLVVVLKPIGADDVRQSRQRAKRVGERCSPLALG